MRIGVDARFLQADDRPELRDFTNEVFRRLSVAHNEHEFIFFTNAALNDGPDLPKNVTTVTITPKPTNVFLYEWWYNVKLPLAIKKYKVDVFVATYGLGSLTTPVPQVMIVRDLAFLKTRAYFPENSRSFYNRNTLRLIKKSATIVTLSDFVKEELAVHYQVNKQTIQTIGSGTNAAFKTLSWEEREEIKERHAEGWEYFVFTGGFSDRANLINVLKAFSIFKKWQKTNMKLVVTGTPEPESMRGFENLNLNTYKYRNEVFVKNGLTEDHIASIVAASYATIFPSLYEGLGVPVLNAMQCEVPVITSANSSMSEIAEDAALYVNPENPQELAEQMKKIFKDEQLRNRLIEAGKHRVKLFSWDRTATLLWQVIDKHLSK